MKLFCPVCHSSISAAPDVAEVACQKCGMIVDMGSVDTRPGQAQLPVVLDYSGHEIGHYRLSECLGSGGMGTVYKATDTETSKEVAIKLLYPHLLALKHQVERFHREASALRQLNHPRIVGFIEEGESEGRYFLVMELVDGESLDVLLKRGPLDPHLSILIATQISEALEAAHAKGIVHRDHKLWPTHCIELPRSYKTRR